MTGLFGKIFGGKKKKEGIEGLVEEALQTVIEIAKFDISFDIKRDENNDLNVDMFGKDEELLISKEGQLLDALQLYVRRVAQHQSPDEQGNINLDCSNFRAQANAALIELAEKLKGIALAKGKSVYFRALPPKDRKVIHQYIAEDERVKSRSIGDGHYKKIKIYPVNAKSTGGANDDYEEQESRDETFGNR
jgi:spoIIIJ-associated protein